MMMSKPVWCWKRIQQRLVQLREQMVSLKAEINQLNRQFWVTKADVKGKQLLESF